MTSNHGPRCRVRRWTSGAGLAAAAAAVIGMGTAHADTPDDVLDQAITYFNQGDTVLDAAPTADLGARSADLLSGQETLGAQIAQLLPQLGTQQDLLTPADQTLLASVDEQWVTAAQSVLSADQAFVAADQAGQLSGSGINAADWTVIDADLGLLSADFNTVGASLILLVTGGLDTASTADGASALGAATADLFTGADFTSAGDLAASVDPVSAFDPSVFAELLSSIGL